MITVARRRAPRAINYRRTGMWPGMGDYNPPAVPNYEVCDPRDTACTQRNEAAQIAYTQGILIAQASNDRDLCESNANMSDEPYRSAALAVCASRWPANLASTIPVQNLPNSYLPSAFLTPAQEAAIYTGVPAGGGAATGGQVSFTSPHGTAAKVGDTWLIKITGAAPGGQVTVIGGKNGAQDRSNMGLTDSSGTWQQGGIFTSDQVGTWSETWTVNGAPSGSYTFSVSPGTAPTTPAGAVIVTSSGAPTSTPAVIDPATGLPVVAASGFSFSSLPWWAWAGAAGVAFLAMKGGK